MEKLDRRTYEQLFAIQRSVRYHNRRRRFYEVWNSVTVTISVIGGSSAAASLLAVERMPDTLSLFPFVATAFIAVVSAADLAVGTGHCANLHANLARQFIMLEQRFSQGTSLGDSEYEQVKNERLNIEAGEPPVLSLLNVMCYYEVAVSIGRVPAFPYIPWWRRIGAQWVSFNEYAQRELAPSAVANG